MTTRHHGPCTDRPRLEAEASSQAPPGMLPGQLALAVFDRDLHPWLEAADGAAAELLGERQAAPVRQHLDAQRGHRKLETRRTARRPRLLRRSHRAARGAEDPGAAETSRPGTRASDTTDSDAR
jgi:hypothetical protein